MEIKKSSLATYEATFQASLYYCPVNLRTKVGLLNVTELSQKALDLTIFIRKISLFTIRSVDTITEKNVYISVYNRDFGDEVITTKDDDHYSETDKVDA